MIVQNGCELVPPPESEHLELPRLTNRVEAAPAAGSVTTPSATVTANAVRDNPAQPAQGHVHLSHSPVSPPDFYRPA